MQIFGLLIGFGVVAIGFLERADKPIGIYDSHALMIILFGCFGAILLGSTLRDFLRTFTSLKELLPFVSTFSNQTKEMENQRAVVEDFLSKGLKSEGIKFAESSSLESVKFLAEAILRRLSDDVITAKLSQMAYKDIANLQAGSKNWDMISRLAPSFGMVGTLTGMIRLFKNFGAAGGADLGSNLSLALIATLYGITFGAAIAGPIGHFLNSLVEDRLDCLDRYRQTLKL